MSKVRTRFAPSPTGFLHVGGIRTALFAWLLARQNNGQFILRFEDTDKKREVEGAREHLIESLKALGLDYDEGPDISGPFGPYVQSERLDIYQKWAEKLIDNGRAYADPYSPAEVQAFREQAQAAKKPFLYRNHRPDNPPKWDGSQPLRFKSEPKAYKWHDAVMGDLATGPEVIDDFILIKSDGYPTYNFAHIVDDAEMEISHVIRGQEFIASVPNYLNLYEALGFENPEGMQASAMQGAGEQRTEPYMKYGEGAAQPATPQSAASVRRSGGSADNQADTVRFFRPVLATMPHIMNEQGNKKLSKRDGAKDVLDYLRDGFLPDALVNFIASMGWNDGTEKEIFTRNELVKKFSLEKVQKSGARFDQRRLEWMNGIFIRNLGLDDLYEKVADFWPEEAKGSDNNYKKQVLGLVQERLKYFAELPDLTRFFFTDLPVDMNLIDAHKQLKKFDHAELKSMLEKVKVSLEQSDFSADDLTDRLNKLLEQTGQKPAVLFSLIRVATTWAPASPALANTLAVLGRDKSLARLKTSLETLSEK